MLVFILYLSMKPEGRIVAMGEGRRPQKVPGGALSDRQPGLGSGIERTKG